MLRGLAPVKDQFDEEGGVLHLRIDAGDPQRPDAAVGGHLPGLADADTVQVVLVDPRLDLEAVVGDDLAEAFAAVADLADVQVHVGQLAGDGRAQRQRVQLAAGDLEAGLQGGELGLQLRQLAAAQRILVAIGRDLQRLQAAAQRQLVVDIVDAFARHVALGDQDLHPLGVALQAATS
jgi:hypothetical protein